MAAIIPTWRVAARHGRSNWRLLAVLAAGILVASVLLASAPIYSRAMADLGLTFTIRDELEGRAGATVELANVPLGSTDGTALRDSVAERIDQRLGWFQAQLYEYNRAPRLRVSNANATGSAARPHIHMQSQDGYETEVNLVEGAFPAPAVPGQPVEVAMSQRIATTVQLKVGDTFQMVEDVDTCEREIPLGDAPPPPPPCDFRVIARWTGEAKLVGIVEAKDVLSTFWGANFSPFFEPQPAYQLPGEGLNIGAFVHPETLTGAYAATLPAYYSALRYNFFADPEALSRRNYERATDDITGLKSEIEGLGGFLYGSLEGTLVGFGRSSGYQQTPLTILLLEIAAVALFYTGLVAATVVERQADEITLLRSRGASTWQIASIYLLEGLYLAVPIVIIAPFLAAAATALLGFTPLFSDVSDGNLLPVAVPVSSFFMAALGAALGVAALLVPVLVVAMRGALAHRRGQSRPGVSFIQRYYLDIIFAGLAGLLLWELNEKGSAFEPSATGGVSSDPVLLASPALIIAAVAAMILRFYPMILKLVARFVSLAKAFTLTMSVWQLSRSPGQYTRLALLLMMAIAVGTYAASYSSTAERSYQDRANFETGAELRAYSSSNQGEIRLDGPEIEEIAESIEGVERASAVYRLPLAEIATPGIGGQTFQLLGVDPSVAGEIVWWRDDFADVSPGALLRNVGGPTEFRGLPLPDDTKSVSLWVNPADGNATATVRVRFLDGNGNTWTADYGELGQPGWRRVSVDMINPNLLFNHAPPFRVVAFEVYEPPNARRGSQKPILFDDITAITASGQETLVEGFEGEGRWQPFPTRAAIQDEFIVIGEGAHSGVKAGRLTYSAQNAQSSTVQGILTVEQFTPLPVVVSDLFSEATGLVPGASGRVVVGQVVVPITVRGNFTLFPTLPTAAGPSVIFNRDQLASYVNTFSISTTIIAQEIWMDLEPGADEAIIEDAMFGDDFGLDRTVSQAAELNRVKSNPLIVAGGTGILVVAFLAVLVLVGMAMLVSLWTAVQRRRVEFAVLRALGTSKTQILRVLTLEYAVVVAVGILGGGYLGLFVARRMLSFLNVTQDGDRVEPSFILQTDWVFVAASCGVVLIVFAGAMIFAVRVIARTSDAQALRTE